MRTMTKDLRVGIDFDIYPPRHTCEGDDLSPGFSLMGLTSPFFAVVLDDPDAPENPFYHWVAWDIEAQVEVPEGISPVERPPELPGARQGLNSGGTYGYSGPCPPRGTVHRYYLRVFGLNERLDLPPASGGAELMDVLEEKAVQYGEAMAKYGR